MSSRTKPSIAIPIDEPPSKARRHGALLHQVMASTPARRGALLKELLTLIQERAPISLSKVAPSPDEVEDPALDAAIHQKTVHIAIGSLVDWDDADSNPEVLRTLLGAYVANGYISVDCEDLDVSPYIAGKLTGLDRAIRGGRAMAATVFIELGADLTKVPGKRYLTIASSPANRRWIEAGDHQTFLAHYEAFQPETVAAVRGALMRRVLDSRLEEESAPAAPSVPAGQPNLARRRQGL